MAFEVKQCEDTVTTEQFFFLFSPSHSLSQSRVPGTVIPLCAAQCERMFNTTRTPGEETGKHTCRVIYINTHF